MLLHILKDHSTVKKFRWNEGICAVGIPGAI